MSFLLSVLIPTYNGQDYLSFALNSILAQEDSQVECIVIDDGSSDQTLSILEQYKEILNLTVIEQGRGGNWVASTNHALRLAQGDYVCMLHQDDVWHKERLRTIRPLIESQPSIGFFLHAAHFIDASGRYLGRWRCPLPAYPSILNPEIVLPRLLIQNFIAIPAPIFRRETALAVGGLDENLWYTADWDFWLKLALQSPTLYYPKPLCSFRVHPASQTETRSKRLDEFQQQHEIVFKRYSIYLNNIPSGQAKIQKTARFSAQVNVALAAAVHQNRLKVPNLITGLFQLGPSGLYRYLRDSRIWERLAARLRMRAQSWRLHSGPKLG